MEISTDTVLKGNARRQEVRKVYMFKEWKYHTIFRERVERRLKSRFKC